MAVKQIYACYNKSVTPTKLISLQPIVHKADQNDQTLEDENGLEQIRLNRLGLQTVRENQFYSCETWQATNPQDRISRLHLPRDPQIVEFALQIETDAGEKKEFGLLMGPRATFGFQSHEFIGFFGQVDSKGDVVYIGILENQCSEAQWEQIRQAESNPVIIDDQDSDEQKDTDENIIDSENKDDNDT